MFDVLCLVTVSHVIKVTAPIFTEDIIISKTLLIY